MSRICLVSSHDTHTFGLNMKLRPGGVSSSYAKPEHARFHVVYGCFLDDSSRFST